MVLRCAGCSAVTPARSGGTIGHGGPRERDGKAVSPSTRRGRDGGDITKSTPRAEPPWLARTGWPACRWMRVRDRSRGGDSLAGGRYRGLIVCPDDRRQIASTRRVEPPPAPASSARAVGSSSCRCSRWSLARSGAATDRYRSRYRSPRLD